MKRLLRIVAWLVLVFILIVTVGPINLRPISGEPADVERFGAFFVVGTLFALAYPRHWLSVLLLTVGCAGLFELLQRLAPGRHGEIADFLFKAAGAVCGTAAGYLLSRLVPANKS
ncbi:VanZ family protein [Ochrobactrum sp. Q0168]|uniref:VanZ family protein n=1 Tax=Ochrobactrum sp. Q0168 TaxID=2793241 RepID=UPI0018EAF340|nr:VanZ family protein [Ochrobactrum sp. Q0168]